MKDNYGDRIDVYADGDSVATETHFDGHVAEHRYTPAKARKLARKLRRVADVAEGIEPVRDAYVLRLTEDQAKTLSVILARIGGTVGQLGTPMTARKYAEEIRQALESAGVDGDAADDDPRFMTDRWQRAIYFIGVAE